MIDTQKITAMRATRRIDMTGRRYGRLVVQRLADAHQPVKWACLCDCGRESVTTGTSLRSGRTTSCGCYKRQQKTRLRHGQSASAEYGIWSGMRKRCLDSGRPAYPDYGGRGITVCERWSTFENFLADMGARPSPSHSIDRIDNDQGYEPGNCRWATQAEQSRNTSSTKLCMASAMLIRAMRARGVKSSDLAHAFGVSHAYVCRVVARAAWVEVSW